MWCLATWHRIWKRWQSHSAGKKCFCQSFLQFVTDLTDLGDCDPWWHFNLRGATISACENANRWLWAVRSFLPHRFEVQISTNGCVESMKLPLAPTMTWGCQVCVRQACTLGCHSREKGQQSVPGYYIFPNVTSNLFFQWFRFDPRSTSWLSYVQPHPLFAYPCLLPEALVV